MTLVRGRSSVLYRELPLLAEPLNAQPQPLAGPQENRLQFLPHSHPGDVPVAIISPGNRRMNRLR